ncbi:MAG: hypothetical protein FNNCIFGK_00868 [Bacteroidia bacterium]|nr:hypothetical protein [Bacteroidia bacterium]
MMTSSLQKSILQVVLNGLIRPEEVKVWIALMEL